MKAVIAPCAQFHIYCKTYSCTNPVKWQIGHPQGPIATMDLYCDACVRNMLADLPEELQPEDPKGNEVPEPEELPLDEDEVDGPPIYECDQCGKCFLNPRGLASHISKAHKE